MNFKEYDNFINSHKYDMTHFIIYYNLKCGINYFDLEHMKITDDEIKKLIAIVYDAYMKDEQHNDLGYICDKALENFDDIMNDKMNKWELLERCV